MPRNNYPGLPASRLIYANYMRRQAEKKVVAQRRAKKRSLQAQQSLEKRMETIKRQIAGWMRRIDRLERYPSKLAVQLLKDMARSSTIAPDVRLRASEILLRWGDGAIHVKRRRSPRRRDKGSGA